MEHEHHAQLNRYLNNLAHDDVFARVTGDEELFAQGGNATVHADLGIRPALIASLAQRQQVVVVVPSSQGAVHMREAIRS